MKQTSAPRSSGRRAAGRGAQAAADPTRDIAFDIVTGVIEHRRMLETSMENSPVARQAEPRDRAAAHRLGASVLRHMGTATEVLSPFLKKEPPEPVRAVLLIGVAQLLFLGTPVHAAVATSVALARRRGLAPFAGLVNAVLRRIAQNGDACLDGLDQERLDVPPWLWTSWGRMARPIAAALGMEPPLDLSMRPGCLPPPGGEVLPNGTVRFPAGTRVTELPGFAEGAFWVQDAAATLPARLLDVKEGERVADLCAAPGGKTAQLAFAGAEVTAVERDARRVERLQANLARLKLSDTVRVVQADATQWRPEAPLDAVLLDAPCSATGTVRRHPDALWIKRPRDLAGLAAGQQALLKAARDMLRPGGRLVYAVCSLQPEEGPACARAAEEMGLIADPFTPEELSFLPQARTPEGWLRTHPGLWAEQGGMDGFFAARFRRA